MADYSEEYKIAGLIAKAFTGILSPEEEKILAGWRENNPEWYEIILDRENRRRREEFIQGTEIDSAWEKVKKAARLGMRRKKSIFTWAVAASIVLCIGVGIMLYWLGNSLQNEDHVRFTAIETGSSKAILITSEGRQFMLEDTTVRQISLESGIVATNDGKRVMYHAPAVKVRETETKYNTVKVPYGGEDRKSVV